MYNILNMTFSASLMIIIIEIMRRLTQNRVSRRVFYGLWMLAAIRMIVPFGIPFGFSFDSLLQRSGISVGSYGSEVADAAAAAGVGNTDGELAVCGYIHYTMILKFVWIAGAIGFAAYFIITYIRNIYKFRESLPVDGSTADMWAARMGVRRKVRVRESDYINSPLTYGIVRPVILMPAGSVDLIEEEQLGYIFAHELVHIKRFDSIAKIFVMAAVCVNWFNPFAWVMYVLVNRDIELSCDEAVVRRIENASRSDYAMTLVRFAELKETSIFAFNSFGKSVLTERVNEIMTKKKTGVLGFIAGFVICLLVIGAVAVSSYISDTDKGEPPVTGNEITDTKEAEDNTEPAKVDTAAPDSNVSDKVTKTVKQNTARVTKKSTSTSKKNTGTAAPAQKAPSTNETYTSSGNLVPSGDVTKISINDPNDSEFFISAGYGYTKAELEAMRGERGSGGTNSSGSASPDNLQTNGRQ